MMLGASNSSFIRSMPMLRLHFLGAGDAFSAAGRHHASYLVEASDTSFLLDCGATALASFKRDRINPLAIDTILLSHLHGDHFSGLPFLFLEFIYEAPRERPLRIAGPPGTEERVRTLFQTMYRERALQPLPFPLEFTEMQPGTSCHIGAVRIDPFRVPHQETEISLGLRIAVAGKTLLYSGDTGWTEELVLQSRNTDVFLCECTFFETRVGFHLDYPRLHDNQSRFETDRLILTHLGREALAHRKEMEIETAYDGLHIEI